MNFNSMNIHGVVFMSVERMHLETSDFQIVNVKVLDDRGSEFTLTLFCSRNRDNIDVDVKGL